MSRIRILAVTGLLLGVILVEIQAPLITVNSQSGATVLYLPLVVAQQARPTSTPTSTPTDTPTHTPTPTSTPTNTPTATDVANAPVLVGAGDIATDNTYGEATARLLDVITGTVFTAGDNVYPSGTLAQFMAYYEPTWGRHKARTWPSPGNHDYTYSGAPGYFAYFGSRAPAPYYAYTLGAWRIYSLNSEISVSATSPQVTWLRADLAAHPSTCVLAYWHKPRWSSGSKHGSDAKYQTLWQLFVDADAEIVITGHEHNYERFAPMNGSGAIDPQGVREFVVGTGGKATYDDFKTILPASEVRNGGTNGVLKLTLHPTGYDWQFVPIAGRTFTDSGSGVCH